MSRWQLYMHTVGNSCNVMLPITESGYQKA